MPLLESKRAPRNPSYGRALTDQVVFLLTGGIVAVGLALLSLVDLMGGFRLPPWVALVTALVVIALAQARAGLRLRDQIRELTGALYRYHPACDDGIDIQEVRVCSEFSGSGEYLNIKMSIDPPDGQRRFLILFDDAVRSGVAFFRQPQANRGEALQFVVRANSANSLTIELTEEIFPIVVTVRIYYSGSPVGLVSVDWV